MSEEPAMSISESQLSASKRENNSKLNEQYRYKMHEEKGKCVIINMENVSSAKNKTRHGTNKDAADLKEIFKEMKFEVEVLKDKKHQEILDYLKGVAEQDHTERSCFVCIILSHGNENGIFAKDELFTTEEVFSLFNQTACNSLAGKPKLFFIQACRGESYDEGITLCCGEETNEQPTPEIFMDADFLCHYSTPPDYVSWRNKEEGSWFIQTLCTMLKNYWKHHDLMHILTLVNNYVSENKSSSGEKQIPYIVSKLTKDLYFFNE